MTTLIPLHDLAREHNIDLQDAYDPTGNPAYGSSGEKIGLVRGALAEPNTGRLRYLIIDAGGWFSSKEVVVPVGLARIEDDAVYFDNLTKAQVQEMRTYRAGEAYEGEAQIHDESILRGSADQGTTTRDATVSQATGSTSAAYNYRDDDQSDTLYKTPDRLQLLEERLQVNKERFVAGQVEVGKRVENRQENVNVTLQREEVVIERHPVTDTRPVEGNVTLGASNETVRVDLEAERANVRKQAYVVEEVTVGEREVTETQTFTETVGREVLDVNQTGDVRGQGLSDATTRTTRTSNDSLTDRAADAIDGLDGKIDRNRR